LLGIQLTSYMMKINSVPFLRTGQGFFLLSKVLYLKCRVKFDHVTINTAANYKDRKGFLFLLCHTEMCVLNRTQSFMVKENILIRDKVIQFVLLILFLFLG